MFVFQSIDYKFNDRFTHVSKVLSSSDCFEIQKNHTSTENKKFFPHYFISYNSMFLTDATKDDVIQIQ